MGALTPLIYRRNKKAVAEAAAEGRPVPPEEHLRIAMLGTWLVPISLFWGAWTCYANVSIWSVLASQVRFSLLLFFPLLSLLLPPQSAC